MIILELDDKDIEIATGITKMKLIENSTTEFKREYTNDIKKTVIAFANTNGGIIHIGIDDDGTAVGVTDIDGTLLQAGNSIRENIRPDITQFVSYKTSLLDDKNIITITVQKGTACPYYLAGKGFRPEGVFVRHGASSVPATKAAILKMIKEAGGEKYERIRSLNQDLTFRDAEKEFQARNIDFGDNQKRTLGLINPDGTFSNLALLLSDQCGHTIKLAVFEGTDKAIFKDRQEFTGSLLRQINEAYMIIDRYNRTKAEFVGMDRIDQRDYPVLAIREALLNAVVHRDYSFSGSTLISIFDDRMEFVSVGGLPSGIGFKDITLGISVARNEALANIFYRLKLIEAYGTGIPRIIASYAQCQSQPEIETTDNAFKITLPMTRPAKHDTPVYLTENEQKILNMLSGKQLSRKEIETALKISQSTAVKTLRKMLDRNLISKLNQGKNCLYYCK